MKDIDYNDLIKIPPFSQEIPNSSLARAKAFIRELAAGAVEEFWLYDFQVHNENGSYDWDNWGAPSPILNIYVQRKWQGQTPNPELLCSLGLMEGNRETGVWGIYRLTQTSYTLIDETPSIPVFISYRNTDSSAFALLLSSRMKAEGLEPFLDIAGLRGGDDWDDVLQSKITSSEYCVALLGPTTLASEYVRKELILAHRHNVRIIPVFHNGFNDAMLRDLKTNENADLAQIATFLEERQGIAVERERARDYNAVVNDILNVLGVTP